MVYWRFATARISFVKAFHRSAISQRQFIIITNIREHFVRKTKVPTTSIELKLNSLSHCLKQKAKTHVYFMRYVKGNAHAGKRTLEGQRNPGKRWNERNNPTEKIKPAKHLLNNINHSFKWETYCLLRKIREKRKF